MHTDYITVSSAESPELYSLILDLRKNHDMEKRILAYAKALSTESQKHAADETS